MTESSMTTQVLADLSGVSAEVIRYYTKRGLLKPTRNRRTNHKNLHVRGYKEEGTTTTPFDMVVLNDLDRFHLVMDVIERTPQLEKTGAHVRQKMRDKLIEHKDYIRAHGDDLPEIKDWKWTT